MADLHASRAGPEQHRWLTLGQACRLLGVDESTLRRWADSGQVHAFRTLGGHRRFAESDVRALLARTHDGQRDKDPADLPVTRIRRLLLRSPAREPWGQPTVAERSRER